MLTRYEKEVARTIAERCEKSSTEEIVEKLCRIGVVDHTLCKVLAVRQYVDRLVAGGCQKVDAMWLAAGHFSASYEYIRKCIYYYKDINA